MYGHYGTEEPKHLKSRLKEIEKGKYKSGWGKLLKADTKELKKLYAERERESD
jgi:ketol-acid reductoisomerase